VIGERAPILTRRPSSALAATVVVVLSPAAVESVEGAAVVAVVAAVVVGGSSPPHAARRPPKPPIAPMEAPAIPAIFRNSRLLTTFCSRVSFSFSDMLFTPVFDALCFPGVRLDATPLL